MFDLTGKTALVTGAGRSVGRGVAQCLAEQGAQVLVNDVDEISAAKTVASITEQGCGAEALIFDVTDLDAVRAATADHDIDILVNNAGNGGVGGMVPTPFAQLDPAAWAGPVDVNLYGVMNCCHVVINGMIDRGWGRIITIGSGAGTVGVNIGVTPYSAGKGGSAGFMRSLALEVAGQGITCNSLALSIMRNAGGQDITEKLERSIPVGRLGQPREIGAMCVYLASEEAGFTTGQTIGINGGRFTS
ncbi:MAG: SDR family NAD(P)-dependent oxidoreductase [Acidimicrobiales bacterium]|nr:SDR family NAD(P)-dependent oxidoreductase [Acidimicrobiales bacterium]